LKSLNFPEFAAADSSTGRVHVQLRVNRLSFLADYHATSDQIPDECASFCPILGLVQRAAASQ